MKQSTHQIFMVRPTRFQFNNETAISNAFQKRVDLPASEINRKVIEEFDAAVTILQKKKINVIVFEDTLEPPKPDAVFPNNWLSCHEDGTLILYPMNTVNRRAERREDIIQNLKSRFNVKKLIDFSHHEKENRFLEGTGSIVFDHDHRKAFACLSPRTDKQLLEEVCSSINYTPVAFYAHDKNGSEIYHTNVMMAVGEKFAVICMASIKNDDERKAVADELKTSNHEIIEISFDQMNCFAGNMLALKNKDGEQLIALSKTAFQSLDEAQRRTIGNYGELIPLPVNTIETIGGGSARCMIAEIFFEPKKS